MLEVESIQLTDPGPTRARNEDYLGVVTPDSAQEARQRGWLLALADGVGGSRMGYVASRTAVEAVRDGFRRAPDGEMLSTTMARLVQQANTNVHAAAREAGPDGSGMATTLVMAAMRHDRAVIAHVGDSRCYHIRGDRVTFVTSDHTIVNEQRLMGLITLQEQDESGICHILSRALGTELFVSPEISELQLIKGDLMLLCSDGLHNGMSDKDLKRIVAQGGELQEMGERLLQHGLTSYGQDNTSLVLARVLDVERVGMYRGRPYKMR
jgi:protein phosphatase